MTLTSGCGTDTAPASASPVTFLVMAKAPVPGLVKTRLTPAFSPHEAAALAAAALLDTLDVVLQAAGQMVGANGLMTGGMSGAPPRVVVALSGDLDHAAAPDAIRDALAAFTVVEQRGKGLGPRLAHAHRNAAGEFGATVQIGMDTPQLSAAALVAAAGMVVVSDGADAVLGLAEDGGWWLLALRRAGDARLIAQVPTSTPETGRLTSAALRGAGLTVEAVPALRDIDEPPDVAAVARVAPNTRFGSLAATLGPRGRRSA